jgi:hypothetical protein
MPLLRTREARQDSPSTKTNLSHLPDRKRRDLDRIVEILFAEPRMLRATWFRSGARHQIRAASLRIAQQACVNAC